MAQHGPAPKLQRQRRGAPVRGDWQQLDPLEAPCIPELDEIPVPDVCLGHWPYTARVYWDAWRKSPVTARWVADDLALAIDTITHYAKTTTFSKGDGGVPLPAGELRIRMESLGLTPKGRADRRFLLPDVAGPEALAELHVLHNADQPAERLLPDSI